MAKSRWDPLLTGRRNVPEYVSILGRDDYGKGKTLFDKSSA